MKNNYLKTGIIALIFTTATVVQAQDQDPTTISRQTDAALGQVSTSVVLTPDVTNPNTVAGTPGATVQGGAIRVIDNKGTKKYLQVQNGITQVTNTQPDGGVITTWQLGGQLCQILILTLMQMRFHLTMSFRLVLALLMQLHYPQMEQVLDGLYW